MAEVGLNHNGELDRALEMIHVAATAGCDAVKFQTFKASGVCDPDQVYSYTSQGQVITEPRINIFRRAELAPGVWPLIKAECEAAGVIFLSTPQNPSDLDVLLKVGVPAIKVGSDDLTNHQMLRYCARDDVGLPIILSCGMSDLGEVYAAMEAVRGVEVALLVCTSQYPCPPADANLRRIQTLRTAFRGVPVGFSDHTVGHIAAVTAVGLGACVFEKHFTLDHDLPGPDHGFSADPNELLSWVAAIREAHIMLGSPEVKPTHAELQAKPKYQRTKVAA